MVKNNLRTLGQNIINDDINDTTMYAANWNRVAVQYRIIWKIFLKQYEPFPDRWRKQQRAKGRIS